MLRGPQARTTLSGSQESGQMAHHQTTTTMTTRGSALCATPWPRHAALTIRHYVSGASCEV